MNKTLITTLLFVFLLLFIISPFASLASLMLLMLIAAFVFFVGNLVQAILGGKKADNNSL
jgi:ABC-type antimicrobial peptide transport system permease subunit